MQVLQEEGASLSLSELAQKVGLPDRVESIYILLRHLQANKRGVVLDGNLGQPSSLKVSAS
jgi:glucose-6-phosphate isomerase